MSLFVGCQDQHPKYYSSIESHVRGWDDGNHVESTGIVQEWNVFLQSFNGHGNKCHRTPKDGRLEYGPMPNVMAALPNTGGALCSTPQCLADAQYCSTLQ